MKTLLLALMISSSAFAQSAEVILKHTRNLGLHAGFKQEVLTIDSKGKILSTTTAPGDEEGKSVFIAQLSKRSVESIKKQIASLNLNSGLETTPTGGPGGGDMGNESIDVVNGATETPIYKKGGGQVSYLQYHAGSGLLELVLGLTNLN